MNVLRVIASGSNGNGYVLTTGDEKLLLEAGVREKDMLKAINYDIEGVAGVLVSHRHNDHSKHIPQYARYFNVYGNLDLRQRFPQVKALSAKKRYKIGNFDIMPLEVEHNIPNFAYVIDHKEMGRLVFATDCVGFPYMIKDCNHLLIECNYVEDVVLNSLLDGDEVCSQCENHMELLETIESVRRLQNPLLRNVILCHLSSGNADRKVMTERFEQELGITPKFATARREFDVKQFDF